MNIKDLESPLVNKFDEDIDQLKESRKEFLKFASDKTRAYYTIKKYIKDCNYTYSVLDAVKGYEQSIKNKWYVGHTMDDVLNSCYASCKILFDAGYVD